MVLDLVEVEQSVSLSRRYGRVLLHERSQIGFALASSCCPTADGFTAVDGVPADSVHGTIIALFVLILTYRTNCAYVPLRV